LPPGLPIDRSIEGKEKGNMAPQAEAPSPDAAERIRQSALHLFAKRGYEATGIRDVARDAGLSLASIYHYIGSKEDLLLDIIKTSMFELRAGAERAMDEADTPVEQLAGLVRAHVMMHGRMRLEALVSDTELRSLSESERKGAVKLRDRYEERWDEVIEAGVAAGEFEVAEPKLVRLALLQMCTGVAYWYSPAGDASLPHIADSFAELALSMVGYEQPAGHGSEVDPR
jgi:AcrR family transcriptional regulator